MVLPFLPQKCLAIIGTDLPNTGSLMFKKEIIIFTILHPKMIPVLKSQIWHILKIPMHFVLFVCFGPVNSYEYYKKHPKFTNSFKREI